MPLILSEAIDDVDFDRLLDIQIAAFGQTGDAPREPMMDLIYPGAGTPPGKAAAKERVLTALRSDPTATFLKVTDTVTGEILGGAKWNVYLEKPAFKPVVAVGWEGKEEREYAELVLARFSRSRFESTPVEGPYLCKWVSRFVLLRILMGLKKS